MNQRRVLLQKKPQALSRKGQIQTAQQRSSPGTLLPIVKSLNGKARICIIRSVGGIGDVLMTTPIVRHLHEEFPDLHITYAADRHSTKAHDVYYQLLKNARFINEIIDARFVDRSKYDAWVDISSVCIKHENSRLPMLNRIDIFARACGINHLKNPVPFYQVEPAETNWATAYLQPYRSKKLVLLHTASFDTKRTWPVSRQKQLIELAATQRPDILFLVSDFNNLIDNKHTYTNVVDVSKTSIRELAALIDQVDLFVGPDSGPMHIAGALRKNALALFGSIPPQVRINYYRNHEAVTSEPKLSCQFCMYQRCQIGYKCMSNITAEQVFVRIKERL